MEGDVVMNSLAITQVILAIIASIQNSNSLTVVCFHRITHIAVDERGTNYYFINSTVNKNSLLQWMKRSI